LAWHARYELEWGHKVASREGPVEVTRKVYNEQAGVETPRQPSIPECAAHVWGWWFELNARRGPGFDSLAPISYSEIKNWILLTGKLVTYEEIAWLVAMDNAWLLAIAEERRARSEREKEEAEIRKGR
jgi:hypothetical protein